MSIAIPSTISSGSRLAEPRPVLRGLRLRDRFADSHEENLRTCRAETRSQGIATSPRRSCARWGRSPLAEPRPVLRGLRPGELPTELASTPATLQSRDPFSGDCDSGPRSSIPSLVSATCRAETRSQGIATGFRSGTAGCFRLPLAEPRPVLRGLRRAQGRPGPLLRGRSPCRAETRSQGIATRQTRRRFAARPGRLAEPRPVLRGSRLFTVTVRIPGGFHHLAEPRHVLWGLRASGPATTFI